MNARNTTTAIKTAKPIATMAMRETWPYSDTGTRPTRPPAPYRELSEFHAAMSPSGTTESWQNGQCISTPDEAC